MREETACCDGLEGAGPEAGRFVAAGSKLPESLSAVAVTIAALLVAALVNPLGYRGGGADDWHYLEAARCAAAHGLCPPIDHWWARLPLVMPMGGSIALGGESRLTVALVPFAYALVALTCFTLLVHRHFGRGAAMVAGILLATLPVAAISYLQPNVDMPELAFLMAGFLAFDCAVRRAQRRWAWVAGLLLGLAILTRPTALVILPILAWLIFRQRPLRRLALPLALGIAAPLLVETLFYGMWLGDPLIKWRLALGHAAVATDELPPGFHSARGPLLNPDYIAAWRMRMDIHVHWTIDPILNLLANPIIGTSLVATLVLLLLSPPSPKEAAGRAIWFLLGAAILYFGALTYGLAVDPKPRMFLPVAAAGAAIAGIQVMRLKRRNRELMALALAGLVVTLSLIRIYIEPDTRRLEPVAARWLAQDGARLSIEDRTARFLTLVPGVRALPLHPTVDRPLAMVIGFDRCEALPNMTGWHVRRSYYEPAGRDRELLALCMFQRASAQR